MVDVIVLDKLKIKGTIDNGSQVISMHARVWRELGVGRRSDHVMSMESANQTRDETLGLLPHLKVNIGGLDFYLQVQVIENASFDLLLGRPFLVLARSLTKDYADGGQDITLTDPHNGAQVTVPTSPKRPGLDEIVQVGF
jgi:Aspartyl protease